MVINTYVFFDDKIDKYISKIGKNLQLYTKFFMMLLYDESPKSDVVRETINNSQINAKSGVCYVLTFMPKLPDYVVAGDCGGADVIKSEFEKYDSEKAYAKMRFIATRFGVRDMMPVLLIANIEKPGCIPIKLSEYKDERGITDLVANLTNIICTNSGNMSFAELKELISNEGLDCKLNMSKSLINTVKNFKKRNSPMEVFEKLYNKYRIGRGYANIMTKSDLAKEIGVSEKQLRQWELDKATPSFESLIKIKKAIGASDEDINDLLEAFGYRHINRRYKEDCELLGENKEDYKD